MGLFSRRRAADTTPQQGTDRIRPSFTFGRKLRTDLSPESTIDLLEGLAGTYRNRQYPELPLVCPATARVAPGVPTPEHFVHLRDQAGEYFFLSIWPDRSMALFALAQNDLDQTTLFGHWKMRDPSLTSIGRADPGMVGLGASQVAANYVEEILAKVGYPVTAANTAALAAYLGEMFLLKAAQFIEEGLTQPADRFVASHRPITSVVDIQQICTDLAAIPGMRLPYIQDEPYRVRALVLKSGLDSWIWAKLPDQPR